MLSPDYSPSGRHLGGWNTGVASPYHNEIPVPFLPAGIAVDTVRAVVYVADSFNSYVRTFTLTLDPVARFGGFGESAGQFMRPCGIAVDRHGNVYVADQYNHRVQKLAPDGEPLAQWGTYGVGPGKFIFPTGVAVDRQGYVYVTDSNTGCVQKLSPSGEPLAQWGKHGRKPGQFKFPDGIVVDSQGSIYVADAYNDRVQKLSSTGDLLAVLGKKGEKPGEFRAPRGIAVDAQGALYVAEWSNGRIQKLLSSGAPLAIWGEHGSGAGQFREPCGVAVDEAGVLYVADAGNERVQKISPLGELLGSYSMPDEEAVALQQHRLAARKDAEAAAARQRARRTYAVPSTMLGALKDLIHQLVLGNVELLEADGRAGDRTAEDIRRVIVDYGGTLIDPPDAAFEEVLAWDRVPTNLFRTRTFEADGDNPAWSITLALWTQEEGQSGLHLEVWVHPEQHPLPVVIRDVTGFPPKLMPAIREVVHRLVLGQYAELIEAGCAPGWTAAVLEETITEYQEAVADDDPGMLAKNVLLDLPDDAFTSARAYGINGDAASWNVDVDLWMAEEGHTALTLQAYVRLTPAGVHVEITDIHVL